MSAEQADASGGRPGSADGLMEDILGGTFDDGLFKEHFENLPGPAYIWRRDGSDFKLVAFNKAAMERVRTTATEFRLGGSARALQNDFDFVGRLEGCLAEGDVRKLEIDYRYRSGAVRRLAVTLIPIHSEHVVHHTEDITERHEAEQALLASEARLRALMDAHPDSMMRVRRDGLYLDAHVPEENTRRLGFRAEHFVGRRVDEIFEPDFARMHAYYREAALAKGGVQKWEYTRVLNGSRRFVEARFVPSGEDEVMITVTDVTDRVDLERAIVNSVERERYKIGHDLHDGLGQILTGVKLMLEPLRRKLPASGSQDGKNLQQAVDLINQAIAQTSELARGLSPVPREAGATLSHALEQLAKRSQSFFGIACRVEAAKGFDERLSEQCANNLYRIAQEAVTNAVKHGRATEVTISARLEKHGLSLTVEDDGRGFSAPSSPGGGMGLHIMRYRARALGGELKIGQRSGGGAIVSVYCPFVRHVQRDPRDGRG